MPIFIHLANLVIEKLALEACYPGGVAALRARFAVDDPGNNHQEDGELLSISAMNPDALYALMQELGDMGLGYDPERPERNGFALILRYGGPHLRPDWLRCNALHAWHRDCPEALQEKAERLGRTSVEELVAMQQAGEQVFETLLE